MSYLKFFDHKGQKLLDIASSNAPVPRIGEEVVLGGRDQYLVKKVIYDIARGPESDDYLGAEVTLHAPDIVTCEICKTSTKDTEVKYPSKYGGQPKCMQPSDHPEYEFCGGRLYYSNGKPFDPKFNTHPTGG